MPQKTEHHSSLQLSVAPSSVVIALSSMVIILLCLHAVALYVQFGLGHDRLLGFLPILNLNAEQSVPAWFSSALLLFCSVLLSIIVLGENVRASAYVRHWSVLALGFLVLSIDESVSLHEKTTLLVRRWLPVHGLLYYHGWILPAVAGLVVLVLFFLNFLRNLPQPTRFRFVVAGLVYVGGAVGMEIVSSLGAGPGVRNFTYSALTTVEELLELFGLVLFVRALLLHIGHHWSSISIHFRTDPV